LKNSENTAGIFAPSRYAFSGGIFVPSRYSFSGGIFEASYTVLFTELTVKIIKFLVNQILHCK
jgi:hypothetical protein